jgi:hypothetical protein
MPRNLALNITAHLSGVYAMVTHKDEHAAMQVLHQCFMHLK